MPLPVTALIGDLSEEIGALIEHLQAGALTAAKWKMQMTQLMARYHLAAAMAGADTDSLGDDQLESVKSLLAEQIQVLTPDDFEVKSCAEFIAVSYWAAKARDSREPQKREKEKAEKVGTSLMLDFWQAQAKRLAGEMSKHYAAA